MPQEMSGVLPTDTLSKGSTGRAWVSAGMADALSIDGMKVCLSGRALWIGRQRAIRGAL